MPVWLIQAMLALRSIGIPGRAIGLGAGAAGTLALPGALSSIIPDFGPFRSGRDDADRPRRRRRRRALTQSDRDDIAFVAATISKSVAGSFAIQLATRGR